MHKLTEPQKIIFCYNKVEYNIFYYTGLNYVNCFLHTASVCWLHFVK